MDWGYSFLLEDLDELDMCLNVLLLLFFLLFNGLFLYDYLIGWKKLLL